MSWIFSSNQIFRFLIALLYTSITGSIASLCVLACYWLLKKHDQIKICYRMLCGTQFFYLVPVMYWVVMYMDKKHGVWAGVLFLHTPVLHQIFPWFVMFWIIGVLVALIWQFKPAFLLRKQKKHIIPCEISIQASFEEICQKINISSRRIRIVQSYAVCVPFCINVFRPIIVIPVQNYTNEELSTILTHELIHIRQKDNLFKHLFVVIKSIHFFNPMIWIVSPLIERWSEYVCDIKSIQILGSAKSYFNTLVKYTPADEHQNRFLSALGQGSITTTQRLRRYVYYQNKEKGSKASLLSKLIPMIACSIAIVFGLMCLLTDLYNFVFEKTYVEEIEEPAVVQPVDMDILKEMSIHTSNVKIGKLTNQDNDIFFQIDSVIEPDTLFITEPLYIESNTELVFLGVTDAGDTTFLYGIEYPDGTQRFAESQIGFLYHTIIEEPGYYKCIVVNIGEKQMQCGCTVGLELNYSEDLP